MPVAMAIAVHDNGPTAPTSSMAFATASVPRVAFAAASVPGVAFATATAPVPGVAFAAASAPVPGVAFAAASAPASNAFTTTTTATADALPPHENEVRVIGVTGRQTGESRIQLNAGSKGRNAGH